MNRFECPHCSEPVYSVIDKYLAAKWIILKCRQCQKRACSTPLLLAPFYLLYLMDVINFGYLSYLLDSHVWLAAMVIGWLILDLFSIYLPLSALGPGKAAVQSQR